jgi:hypothetical protein
MTKKNLLIILSCLIPFCVDAQTIIGPLQTQNNFSEIKANGTQSTAEVNLFGYTITLGGNFTTSGANSLTLTTTGATNVTLPTTGTLLTNSDAVTSFNTRTGAVTLTSGDVTTALGFTPVNPSSAAITGGTINGTSIGATTPSTGAFTTLSATTPLAISSGGTSANVDTAALSNILGNPSAGTYGISCTTSTSCTSDASVIYTPSNVDITGGTINGTSIGATTPSTGAFTTLNASGNDALLYQNTSGQVISNATVTTVTNWTKNFDRLGTNFNATTGVFTAPTTAYYEVNAGIRFNNTAGSGVGNEFDLTIVGNSVNLCTGENVSQTTTAVARGINAECLVFLTSGETINITVFQDSGNTQDLASAALADNYLSIVRVP